MSAQDAGLAFEKGECCSLSWVYLEDGGLVKDIVKHRITLRTKERFTRTVLRIITVLLSIWNAGMLEAHGYFWSTRRIWLTGASKKERKIVFKRSAMACNWRTSFQKASNGSDFTQLSWRCYVYTSWQAASVLSTIWKKPPFCRWEMGSSSQILCYISVTSEPWP